MDCEGVVVVKRLAYLGDTLIVEYEIYDGTICLIYLVVVETDVYICGCFTYTKWRF